MNKHEHLSEKAVEDLRVILQSELGSRANLLTKEDLEKAGLFLLSLTAEAAKAKMRRTKAIL